MHRMVMVLGGLVTGLVGAGAWAVVAPAVAGSTEPDTIVRVDGDAAHGFAIHHHDGTVLYPPTDSEARAECGEYHRRVARVRCRTEVRTWYRDLAELQRSLEWARSG
ncbi:hypothetical protein [Nocardioides coralli]|uniref:hypothetical protein n=1 Tax=Nocardioides coralli TaxID=2872154 RepID=UPI001CA42308|nr:hypothetical protein [Nocardioides coralli]QZY29759.1 hypothetical protein K6T13_03440 [Nocardioides coralli]